MLSSTPSFQQAEEFVYTQCNNCGKSLLGPNINKKVPGNKYAKVIFQYLWNGDISDENGLRIFTPDNKKFTILNDAGVFKIKFSLDKDPFITYGQHICDDDHSVTEIRKRPIITPEATEQNRIYLGFCTLAEHEHSFSYGGSAAGVVSQGLDESSMTINWMDGAKIHIEVLDIGIFINGKQYAAEPGTYKIDFFPDANNFLLTKIE